MVEVTMTYAQAMVNEEDKFKGFLHADVTGKVELLQGTKILNKGKSREHVLNTTFKSKADMDKLKQKCKEKMITKIEKFQKKGLQPKGNAFNYHTEKPI